MNLRLARADDLEFIFELRNNPLIRSCAFNQDEISSDTHQQWFLRNLQSNGVLLLIAEENQCRIGQLRFEWNPASQLAEVHIAVVPEQQDKGVGTKILELGSRLLFERFPAKAIVAYIRLDNDRSCRVFQKAGYESRGVDALKGQACIKMVFSNPKHEA